MIQRKRFSFEKNIGLQNNEVFEMIDNNTDEVFSFENELEANSLVTRVNSLVDENEQLKEQIKIFELFLKVNDSDIDWEEFCGVDECAFENPDFSCKDCIHLKGDVE